MSDQQPVMAVVDSVATSASTIRYAAMRARHLDRPLTLLHLIPAQHRLRHHGAETIDSAAEQSAHRVLQEAAQVATTVLPMDRITTRLETGHPTSALAAASMHAHELVIGDAYGAHEHAVAGSDLLAALVTEAPVPLTVVPTDWTDSHDPNPRIVAGIGRTDRIPPAVIHSAFDHARDQHASVEFLHVWDMGADWGQMFTTLPEYPGFQRNSNQQIRMTIDSAEPQHDDVPFDVSTYWGRPAELLRQHATGAALLVLARERHHGLRRGHVSRPLVHHAPCPVHVLPVAWGDGGLSASPGGPPAFATAD